MAHPIVFKPKEIDPHVELMRKVEAAPKEHAEALLGVWELLQTAHDTGLLDLAKGLMGGKDIITGKLAEAAALPESVAAIRNAMAGARILGSVDPEVLQRLAKSMDGMKSGKEEKPLGMFALLGKVLSEDGRRGLTFAVKWLTALGRATRG